MLGSEAILKLLKDERDQLQKVISILDGDRPLAAHAVTKKDIAAGTLTTVNRRRARTPEQREKQSRKMRAYWKKRRAA